MFTAAYSRQAEKFLKHADHILARRLMGEIEKLQENPFPHDVKSVVGSGERLFRVRIGDYRILYEVDHAYSLLGIIKIDKRSRAYD